MYFKATSTTFNERLLFQLESMGSQSGKTKCNIKVTACGQLN